VTATFLDLSGREVAAQQRKSLDIAPSATTDAFTAGWTDDLPDFHLLRLRLTDSSGSSLAENTYWRHRDAQAMQALNRADRTRLSAEVTGTDRSGSRGELTARLRNKGGAVAAMVRVSLVDSATGERVLPTLYSDNYLWLLPGESRTLTLSWPAEALRSGKPRLRVEAYNAPMVSAVAQH
jgi:hypothetical protein